MIVDYSVMDSGIFTEGSPGGGGGVTVFRASNEEFEIQKLHCGWNFYFLKNVLSGFFLVFVCTNGHGLF